MDRGWLFEAGRCARDLGDHDAAVAHSAETARLRQARFGDEDWGTIKAMVGETRSLISAGRFDEAEERGLEIHRHLLTK